MYMVNKFISSKKRCIITSSLLFFFILFGNSCSGQDISKQYTFSYQQDGILYFINPQGDWENKKENAELVYDITYHTMRDSLVFNFSCLSKQNLSPKIITIIIGNDSIISTVDKIFIETRKSKFHYRYSAKFSFEEFYNMIQTDSDSPHILLSLDQENPLILSINGSKWLKQSYVLQKIFNLIALNK